MSNRSQRVVVVVGNPRPASRTADAAVAVGRQVAEGVGAPEPEVVDLATRPAPFGPDAPDRLADALDRVAAARYVIVASPTYKASYTGLLKAFLDLLPSGGLRGAVVVPVMTLGSPVHSLAADHQLRPVLQELGASSPTAAVVLTEAHLADVDGALAEWWQDARPLLVTVTPGDEVGPGWP